MVILVVEDEYLLALSTAQALQQAGHQVLGPAHSVEAALDAAADTTPDLALVDINLGIGGDGRELARALRDRWGVPSLFVTGQDMWAREAPDAALGYMVKPVSPNLILASVEVVRGLKAGRQPDRVPHGLELF